MNIPILPLDTPISLASNAWLAGFVDADGEFRDRNFSESPRSGDYPRNESKKFINKLQISSGAPNKENYIIEIMHFMKIANLFDLNKKRTFRNILC